MSTYLAKELQPVASVERVFETGFENGGGGLESPS